MRVLIIRIAVMENWATTRKFLKLNPLEIRMDFPLKTVIGLIEEI